MDGFDLIIQPDAEDADAAEVFVDATVDGHPYRFLLDTGAARSSIGIDDYTSRFAAGERESSSGVFAPSSHELITVPRIQLGPISRENFTLVREAQPDWHMRNLIGMDLLKDYTLHFLFDQNRVLVNPEEPSPGAAAWYELVMDTRAHPYVEVRLGTVTANAVWDTGAGITIADMRFVQKHHEFFLPAGESRGTDATGAQQATPVYTMAPSVIGDTAFSPVRVAGVDLSAVNATLDIAIDLIAGYNLYRQANWWMDFPRSQWATTQRPG